jgi:rRNA maturation RNase YbeY
MINFNYEASFKLANEDCYKKWISAVCESDGFNLGGLNYIFCDDSYLLNINQTYLQHDDYTDIISFDYTMGKIASGDIYISVERVKENASLFAVSFENELLRVMAHGVLHLMGYKDKSEEHTAQMRAKEEEKIKMFHVEQ